MSSTKKTARLAGLLFLMMVVFGLLAEVMFRQKLFVATGDYLLVERNGDEVKVNGSKIL